MGCCRYRGAIAQMWYVKFVGEEAWDWGGVFREFFSGLGEDVCSDNNELLVRVANFGGATAAEAGTGFNQDTWVPNPSCQAMDQFEFLGRLMAFAILSDENLTVQYTVPYAVTGLSPSSHSLCCSCAVLVLSSCILNCVLSDRTTACGVETISWCQDLQERYGGHGYSVVPKNGDN